MERIDLINILLSVFAVWLVFVPSSKISYRKVFFFGVILFGLGSFFSLISYVYVSEVYFRLALICMMIGIVKAGIIFKDGK
jgi:hypothetical protein